MKTEVCNWIIRPGTNNTYWAYTPCEKGFNYLSKVNNADSIKPAYENRLCPICGKPIKCNTELVEENLELTT